MKKIVIACLLFGLMASASASADEYIFTSYNTTCVGMANQGNPCPSGKIIAIWDQYHTEQWCAYQNGQWIAALNVDFTKIKGKNGRYICG